MSDRTIPKIPDSEITPPHVYFNRRNFMKGAALVGSVVATGGLYRALTGEAAETVEMPELTGLTRPVGTPANGFRVDEPLTSLADVTHYNNFYEFTTTKGSVASAARGFSVDGWQLAVDGMVHKPRVFGLADLFAVSPPEERVYRMRCVEAWSMVIPWAGFPLSRLLDLVEPMSDAKYVAFETLYDPARFPGQKTDVLDWPYVEGLRIDEAMHPLTLLATGLYGRELPAQDGAPVRLVTPWKYGFKGIKSIVKISLVASRPPTSWSRRAPAEYGFLANVNPEVDHLRWSQATERRIGVSGRRPTLPFNGYAEQVADLYAADDLNVDF